MKELSVWQILTWCIFHHYRKLRPSCQFFCSLKLLKFTLIIEILSKSGKEERKLQLWKIWRSPEGDYLIRKLCTTQSIPMANVLPTHVYQPLKWTIMVYCTMFHVHHMSGKAHPPMLFVGHACIASHVVNDSPVPARVCEISDNHNFCIPSPILFKLSLLYSDPVNFTMTITWHVTLGFLWSNMEPLQREMWCSGKFKWNLSLCRWILATANTQFGQEMALVMQTTHAQRWQYPDRVDKRLFSSIENVHRYYKNPWVWV